MGQLVIPEPPCCGCDVWVFAHIAQTVVVADDMLAICDEACTVRAIAGGDSPPTSVKIEINKLAMKYFTVNSVMGHPEPDNLAMSMCYSQHSATNSVAA